MMFMIVKVAVSWVGYCGFLQMDQSETDIKITLVFAKTLRNKHLGCLEIYSQSLQNSSEETD